MKFTEEGMALIKKGESINNISKRTGFSKSTVYHHYKKVLGKKIRPVAINFSNEGELGEFLGIFAGDGSFCWKPKSYHYSVRIHVGYYEKQYFNYLNKKLELWFGKKPHVTFRKYKNELSSIELSYHSKEIYELLKEHLFWEGKKGYTVRLRNFDLENRIFHLGFLRGLIDTDGNYYASKRRLSYSTVSGMLADQVFEIITNCLGVKPNRTIYKKKGRADIHTLALHGDHARKLSDLVVPSNAKKRVRQ